MRDHHYKSCNDELTGRLILKHVQCFPLVRTSDMVLCEGPEGIKWELGFACFCPGKMRFESLGLGFIDWKWEKKSRNGNVTNVFKRVQSRLGQIRRFEKLQKTSTVKYLIHAKYYKIVSLPHFVAYDVCIQTLQACVFKYYEHESQGGN